VPGAELLHQLRNAPQYALLMVLVESLAQAIRAFLRFQLEQEAVEQYQVLAVHLLDFVVQGGLQLLRFNWHGLRHGFHRGKITALAEIGSPLLELFEGQNVILNTPTGSGKSLVAVAN
jgi:hypothetical protein